MRGDLEFLYQKAMRSKDTPFIEHVFRMMVHVDTDKSDILNYRICMLDEYYPKHGKFSFLIGDSQRGADWYRNR